MKKKKTRREGEGETVAIACEDEDECMDDGRARRGNADGVGMSKAREDEGVRRRRLVMTARVRGTRG